jgi:penicillin amidase
MRRFVLFALVLVLALAPLAAKSPKASKPMKMPGLKAAASITRDVYGIAHVRANNDHDMFFLQGWVHAQDRLFQMDLNRRQASGTTAELFGVSALAGDVQFRTLGLRRAAEASVPVLSEDALAMLAAYAAGVNAYVADHPLPPEYGLLEITRFEPWTALDSLAVTKLLAFGLSFGDSDIGNTEALLAYTTALGTDAGQALFFVDLRRSQPFSPASTVPDASGVSPMGAESATAPAVAGPRFDAGAISPTAVTIGREFFDRLRNDPRLGWAMDMELPKGSNEWAIAGENTENGVPLLANDPHLALDVPSTFYPIHIRSNTMDVMGSGFPGVPAVVVGQNRYISWGATVNPMDVTDYYAETIVQDLESPSGLSTVYQGTPEPIVPIPEAYYFNQPGNGVPDDLEWADPGVYPVPQATLIVPRRNMGPILGIEFTPTGITGLSVQFTGFGPTREIETFLAWDRARGLDDFMRGLQTFDFGSQNWAYSDLDGNIAYFTSAEMPIREDLQSMTVAGLPPYFIRNGEGGNEWLPVANPHPGQSLPYEILSPAEMPHIVNPPVGWFVNANNDPAGNTLDNDPLNQVRPGGGIFYLSPTYDGFRGGRITALVRGMLAGGGTISFEDMQAIQADVVLLDAQFLAPHIVQALDNAADDGADPALAAFLDDEAVVEAVRRIAAWGHNTPTGIREGYDAADVDGELSDPTPQEVADSVAATIYSTWRGLFVRNTVDTTLEGVGLQDYRPGDQQSMTAVKFLLEAFPVLQGHGASGLYFFGGGGTGDPETDRDIVILQSVADALGLLASDAFAEAFMNSTDQNDYRWGKLHRIVFGNPLGNPFTIPPAGGAFPNPLPLLPGIPTDGGFNAVDASRHKLRAYSVNDFMFGAGPVNRFVSEAGQPGISAESAWPGGTSGILMSPYYFNLLPFWLTNDTIPLLIRNSDLQKSIGSVTRFVPMKGRPESAAGTEGRGDGGDRTAPTSRGRTRRVR